jgi:aminocarboxymuconate-semialdehyde decarboxylase
MDPIVLDVHAHLVPVVPERLAALAGVTWDAGKETLTLDGHALATKPLFRPDALIRWMDENRIEHAWISIPPPGYRQELDVKNARDWSAYVNDELAAIAARHPTRFSALLHLPVEHPTLAAEIAANGARRFAMSAGAGPEVRLSDAVYEPLWQALDRQSAFLFIHPGTTCDPRLDRFFLRNLAGNPMETGVAASHMVMSGVMARFTNMLVCLAHGGGIVPSVAERAQHGWTVKATGDGKSGAPRDGFRRFCADCITHSPSALAHSAAVFGNDHIFFGSDWPFPMGLLSPHTALAEAGSLLKQAMFADNPRRLLHSFSCEGSA